MSVDDKSSEIVKQKIVLENKEPIVVNFNGVEILVNPYITLDDKIKLIKIYLDSYFSSGEFYLSYLSAEYSIVLAIMDLCTNIDITGIKVDEIINSGLWDEIIPNITNYWEFKEDLGSVIKAMREDIVAQKSVGSVIENASNKISMIIDKMMEIDISQDGINKLIEKIGETKINDKFIPLSDEPVVEKKTRKKKVVPKEL